VCAAAVSADVWDEFFCSAYCTVFQDCLEQRDVAHLKSCLQRSCSSYERFEIRVTPGLESFFLT